MGNFCTCKVFLHQNNEANMDEMKGTDGINSNRPIEIISQYSQLSSMNKDKLFGKADKIKNNLEKKLPEIGTYISENEFKALINDNINEYMQKNKLNSKNIYHLIYQQFQQIQLNLKIIMFISETGI